MNDFNKILEQYDIKFIDKQTVTIEDLHEMKKQGISTETFLSFFGKKYDYLFHGSRNDISFGEQIKSKTGVIFASDKPAIAILKAIFLNNAKNLGYPLNLLEDNSNLILVIDEPQKDTMGEQGYVYIISNKEGFKKDSTSNWQYYKEIKGGDGVSFIKKIEIEKSDLKYSVEIK